MIPKEVEFHIKCRDAFQTLADAHAELLEARCPFTAWAPDEIPWTRTEGARGTYERYPAPGQRAETTTDFKNLVADLKNHNGKLTRAGYFYWLFRDNATIGRKRR
jgi:hypothetical protein